MKKEIELKFLLKSRSDFELFEHFIEPYAAGKKSVLLQENFYFDTSSLQLKRSGLTLRLRKQNDEYWLSAKHSLPKKKAKKNLSVRMEYEGLLEPHIAQLLMQESLSPIDAFFALPSITEEDVRTQKILHDLMQKASKLGLQIIGSFSNVRTKVPINLLGHNLVLEFDHSTFLTSLDSFEIEVEFDSEKKARTLCPALAQLFQAADIKTFHTSSKSARLFKLLKT